MSLVGWPLTEPLGLNFIIYKTESYDLPWHITQPIPIKMEMLNKEQLLLLCWGKTLANELHIRQKQNGEKWPSFFIQKCPKRLYITMGSHIQFLPYNNDKECSMQNVLFAAVIHCVHGKNCWHVEKIFSRKRLKSLSSKKHQRPSSLNPIDFWWRFKRLFTYFPSFLSEL